MLSTGMTSNFLLSLQKLFYSWKDCHPELNVPALLVTTNEQVL